MATEPVPAEGAGHPYPMPRSNKRVVLLVGVDGSESSMRAGSYALGMARRSSRAHLIILFVRQVTALTALGAGQAAAVIKQTEDEIVEELRRTVTSFPPEPNLEVEFLERSGNPYRELMELATTRRADAIVVGASKQAGHRFVGSLAVHLVKNATCPVTVVP